MAAMAHNVGRLMRALFGMGTPRGLQASGDALFSTFALPQLLQTVIQRLRMTIGARGSNPRVFCTPQRAARAGRRLTRAADKLGIFNGLLYLG